MMVRFDPFRDLIRLQDELFANTALAPNDTVAKRFRPVVDLHEDDDAFHLAAELPGVKQEDIHVEVEEGVLTLSAERKNERTEEVGNVHLLERSYGRFERRFNVADKIDVDGIAAAYTDGVLHLTLPKREEEKPRKIEVKIS